MTEIANVSPAATALIVCKDARARQLITESLRPLAIRSEICEEVSAAVRLLDKQKFEAVIVDLHLGEGAMLVMEKLRFSRANRTAVTFAIAAEDGARTPRIKLDSTFVLPRPLSADSISQILRAAYGLVVRERRRYFRCPLAVPVLVRARQPEEEFLGQTVNISEGGIAISTRTMPDPALSTAVRFSLPGRSSQLFSETRVRWSGQQGLVGLEFQSLAAPQKSELQEWLAHKLEETLPENVAALFRSVGQF
ncbi:MAG: PilZ domain-containing protein [Candidatus Sulfotelmatobacter sp.]|jgi:ActR/RegA family two-component response regulator